MVDELAHFEGPEAMLTITYNGEQGEYPDRVPYESGDGDVKQIATEAIRDGYITGIDADMNVDLTNFVVDRFPAKDGLPNRLVLRPKTPFGLEATEEEKEAEGIKAIIALQAVAGIEEPEEKARAGWRGMKDWEKAKTLAFYKMICGEQS